MRRLFPPFPKALTWRVLALTALLPTATLAETWPEFARDTFVQALLGMKEGGYSIYAIDMWKKTCTKVETIEDQPDQLIFQFDNIKATLLKSDRNGRTFTESTGESAFPSKYDAVGASSYAKACGIDLEWKRWMSFDTAQPDPNPFKWFSSHGDSCVVLEIFQDCRTRCALREDHERWRFLSSQNPLFQTSIEKMYSDYQGCPTS